MFNVFTPEICRNAGFSVNISPNVYKLPIIVSGFGTPAKAFADVECQKNSL